ncbi:hypothetical protein L873DRAFT_1792284 [Choiromyces venosus 120613-1]|uniref:Uncharacterized protein n=1 Tax=Choiromyces venosus 120613-1 TaxID=1336337 RepID=A0A3N4JAT8_9PEZI|nr:hypothetical protein L873DRAFT_1792284 [Choiromyces venosus 120613-1]
MGNNLTTLRSSSSKVARLFPLSEHVPRAHPEFPANLTGKMYAYYLSRWILANEQYNNLMLLYRTFLQLPFPGYTDGRQPEWLGEAFARLEERVGLDRLFLRWEVRFLELQAELVSEVRAREVEKAKEEEEKARGKGKRGGR